MSEGSKLLAKLGAAFVAFLVVMLGFIWSLAKASERSADERCAAMFAVALTRADTMQVVAHNAYCAFRVPEARP